MQDARWESALASARWDRRDAVYFEAVRERQALREQLREHDVAAQRNSHALALANGEVDRLREVLQQQQQQWQAQQQQWQAQQTDQQQHLRQMVLAEQRLCARSPPRAPAPRLCCPC